MKQTEVAIAVAGLRVASSRLIVPLLVPASLRGLLYRSTVNVVMVGARTRPTRCQVYRRTCLTPAVSGSIAGDDTSSANR